MASRWGQGAGRANAERLIHGTWWGRRGPDRSLAGSLLSGTVEDGRLALVDEWTGPSGSEERQVAVDLPVGDRVVVLDPFLALDLQELGRQLGAERVLHDPILLERGERLRQALRDERRALPPHLLERRRVHVRADVRLAGVQLAADPI